MARYDILIRGGEVVDGTGSPRRRADVAIRAGRVVAVGLDLAGEATRILDARGKIVAPGFIDVHTHSDAALALDGDAQCAIRQGITTNVAGNCGVSLFPIGPDGPELNFLANATVREHLRPDWTTAAGYLDHLEQEGVSINAGVLTGHGSLRRAVGAQGRGCTAAQLAQMKSLLAESLEDGSLGLSTGLTYAPGCYAEPEEVVALAQVTAQYGGIYATHMRSYDAALVPAIEEALDVARQSGVTLQISHLTPGPSLYGSAPRLLKILEEARTQGVDVACDINVQPTGSTSLRSLCPLWALEGGNERLLERLRDPALRARMRQDILEKGSGTGGSMMQALMQSGEWDKLWLGTCKVNYAYRGKSFAEIARLRGEDPFDMVFNVLLEEEASATFFGVNKSEDDIEKMMGGSFVSLITDGMGWSQVGPLAKEIDHPRNYGAYPWAIRRYVRERRGTTLEEVIHHSTGVPAARFGLTDRGEIREGAWADIVIFDENEIADRGTVADPAQDPVGIAAVLVNGEIVVENGKHTGARPGQVLRRKGG
ncbi:MAG: D-aminoacylase [Anaerolineae bacterium]|nr:D-aminoacylase [Anaerolineae bacterium]